MSGGVQQVEVELGDAWAYGPGILHGGWLLETMTAVALEHTAQPHALAVSAHYLSAPRLGTATIEVEPLREGRSVSTLRVRLVQGGRPAVEVLLTAGTLPAADVEPLALTATPPPLPPVEECVRNRMPEGMPRNGIVEQLDIRLDPACAGFASGTPSGGTEIRAWVRSDTGREVDPLMLLTVADALPPVPFEMGLPGWVPTVELTVLLRGVPAPGWLACVQRARLVVGGWLDEECEVWDSAGRLVVQARQLAMVRPA